MPPPLDLLQPQQVGRVSALQVRVGVATADGTVSRTLNRFCSRLQSCSGCTRDSTHSPIGGPVKKRAYDHGWALVLTAAVTLCHPHAVSAQHVGALVPPSGTDLSPQAQQNVPAKAQDAEGSVERAVKRFGVGVEGGVGLDPELLAFGAHATFGPVFRRNVQFRPGIEFGVGEVTTTLAINLDVLYTFSAAATRQTRWTPYFGAGPSFGLSHRGFESTTDPQGNRFNFSDTSFDAGLNFIAGARNRSGLFLEMRATAYGVSNVRLLAGFNF
jgi:hypothetical protein